jgi:zinc D-Ala-D-Ala dipeptidase
MNKLNSFIFSVTILVFSWGCQKSAEKNHAEIPATSADTVAVTVPEPAKTIPLKKDFSNLPDSALVNILEMDANFVLDVKYATTDNFTKQILYDCEACLLRKIVADSLIAANQFFMTQGYKIKLFDCYRPHSVQFKMWKIVSDDRYVAEPTKGSMHNRGGAVDLSLVDMATGKEMEMGSPYDFFGRESHHAYQNLPKEVYERRIFLKDNLARFGFEPITSEWWHYAFKGKYYNILDIPLPCEN